MRLERPDTAAATERLREVGPGTGPDRLRWLFLDLNSYFASVEQHLDPALRGRAVIVAPLLSDATCAIAASYEAKALGIRTGTRVAEAKRLCPNLVVLAARHDIYVEMHHSILMEVDKHVPVSHVCSIDEMACELDRTQRTPEAATALAMALKEGIARRIGPAMTASIGIAPSRLLAKIASDMQKPNGLVVLGAQIAAMRLAQLKLTDLPGIGDNMARRLAAGGIVSVAQFMALDPRRARAAWGSIGGEAFWYALHGFDPIEVETVRRSIGHSHVISPDRRRPEGVRLVGRRLLAKAAARARRADLRASRLSLSLRLENSGNVDCAARLPATADSFALLATFDSLWPRAMHEARGERIRRVGVVLSEFEAGEMPTPDLFNRSVTALGETRGMRASRALDTLNGRFGRDCVVIGAAPQMSVYAGAKIAFNRIPDRADF